MNFYKQEPGGFKISATIPSEKVITNG